MPVQKLEKAWKYIYAVLICTALFIAIGSGLILYNVLALETGKSAADLLFANYTVKYKILREALSNEDVATAVALLYALVVYTALLLASTLFPSFQFTLSKLIRGEVISFSRRKIGITLVVSFSLPLLKVVFFVMYVFAIFGCTILEPLVTLGKLPRNEIFVELPQVITYTVIALIVVSVTLIVLDALIPFLRLRVERKKPQHEEFTIMSTEMPQ